ADRGTRCLVWTNRNEHPGTTPSGVRGTPGRHVSKTCVRRLGRCPTNQSLRDDKSSAITIDARQVKVRPKSHQRSWWIVHTQPTKGLGAPGPKSHQRSWWIVHTQPTKGLGALRSQIPPTAVGGSFIPGLQKDWRMR